MACFKSPLWFGISILVFQIQAVTSQTSVEVVWSVDYMNDMQSKLYVEEGTNVVFNWEGTHNLVRVSEADWRSCNQVGTTVADENRQTYSRTFDEPGKC